MAQNFLQESWHYLINTSRFCYSTLRENISFGVTFPFLQNNPPNGRNADLLKLKIRLLGRQFNDVGIDISLQYSNIQGLQLQFNTYFDFNITLVNQNA